MWNYKYILVCLIAVVLSFLGHELTHWLMGTVMGYDMKMTLNTVYPSLLKYDKEEHFMIISAVGPAFGLLQSTLFYFLLKWKKNTYFFPFLLSSFYLQLLSAIMNFSKPNDLGRISTYFEFGLFTIPAIIVSLHFFLLYLAIRSANLKRKATGISILLIMLFSSIWILTNQFYKVILI